MKISHLNLLAFSSLFTLTAAAQTPCSLLTTEVDKFTNEVKTHGRAGRFYFERVTQGKETVYYVTINSPGAKTLRPQQGLILLLEGERRINKPMAVIEVVYSGKSTYYNKTRVILTASEWNLLKLYGIAATRLGDNDADVDEPQEIVELLNCF